MKRLLQIKKSVDCYFGIDEFVIDQIMFYGFYGFCSIIMLLCIVIKASL